MFELLRIPTRTFPVENNEKERVKLCDWPGWGIFHCLCAQGDWSPICLVKFSSQGSRKLKGRPWWKHGWHGESSSRPTHYLVVLRVIYFTQNHLSQDNSVLGILLLIFQIWSFPVLAKPETFWRFECSTSFWNCILYGNKQGFTGMVQPFCELIVLSWLSFVSRLNCAHVRRSR